MKVLVTVTETYTHTYLVEAESQEDAIRYAEDKGLDCNVFNDYCETEDYLKEKILACMNLWRDKNVE